MDLPNEAFQEYQIEAYQEYLESLSNEFLNYEYADRLGDTMGECAHYNRGEKIESLLDYYSVQLYADPTITFLPEEEAQ